MLRDGENYLLSVLYLGKRWDQDGRVIAQTIKNLPEMQEFRDLSLDWEDPQKKGMATHFSILARRSPW